MGSLFSSLFSDKSVPDSSDSNSDVKDSKLNKEIDDEANLPPVEAKTVMAMNLKDELVLRMPRTIRGNEFIVDNCQNCDIYVCDRTAQITVDNCKNCRFFFGPCESSAFFRDCVDCKIVIACQQLRLRDCVSCDIQLFCATQPVIESSSKLQFGCFQFSYFTLGQQFEKLKFNVWTNEWFNIFDFTPNQESHWGYLPTKDRLISSDAPGFSANFSVEELQGSIVPYSSGLSNSKLVSTTMILSLSSDESVLWELTKRAVLRRSRSLELTLEQLNQLAKVFGLENSYQGRVYGLEFEEDASPAFKEFASKIWIAPIDRSKQAATMFFEEMKPKVF